MITYEEFENLVKMQINSKVFISNLEVKNEIDTQSYFVGVRSVLNSLLELLDEDTCPDPVELTEEDKELVAEETSDIFYPICKYSIFDKDYIIFNDDYGQCLAIKINGQYIGFGTYNDRIITDLLYFVVRDIFLGLTGECGER